jgi:hypothetical protein
MTPLILETLEEQQCISNLTTGVWRGNYNYWTGATQKGCVGGWSWCTPEGVKPFNTLGNLLWETGQPDNKGGNQDCIHLKYQALVGKPGNFVITDRNCSDKYIFACEVFYTNFKTLFSNKTYSRVNCSRSVAIPTALQLFVRQMYVACISLFYSFLST